MGTYKTKAVRSQVSRNPEVVTARILDAAQEEFMAAGYERANTNNIVARFGGSKATLFRYFPSKQALFEGVIRRIAGTWSEQVKWQDIQCTQPQEWLNEFGCMALKWILSDETLFLGRTGIAEGRLFAQLNELFPKLASQPLQKILSSKLQEWTEQRLLSCADPDRAAVSYFDLVLSGVVSRTLYGVERMHSASKIRAHVKHTVSLFLHGIEGPRRL